MNLKGRDNFNLKSFIWRRMKIKIDRPLWSRHPKYWFVYPVNYGYIEGVYAWDWKEQDVYLLWMNHPVDDYEWQVIAVVIRENDVEDKLVVSDKIYSKAEIAQLINFQEKWFDSDVIM